MAAKTFTFSLLAGCLYVCLAGAVPVDKSTRSWPFAPHALIRRARQADYNVTEDSSGNSQSTDQQCYIDLNNCFGPFENSEFIRMTQAAFEDDQPFVTNSGTLQTLCSEVQAMDQCIDNIGNCGYPEGNSPTAQLNYICTEGRQGYLALNGRGCTMDPFRNSLVDQCVDSYVQETPTFDPESGDNATAVAFDYDHCSHERAWRTCVRNVSATSCGQVVSDFITGVVQSSMTPECRD